MDMNNELIHIPNPENISCYPNHIGWLTILSLLNQPVNPRFKKEYIADTRYRESVTNEGDLDIGDREIMSKTIQTEPFDNISWSEIQKPDRYGSFRIDVETNNAQTDEKFKALYEDLKPLCNAALREARDNATGLERELLNELTIARALISRYETKDGEMRYRIRFKSKAADENDSIPVLNEALEPIDAFVARGDTVRVLFEPYVWTNTKTNTAGVSLQLMGVVLVKKNAGGKTRTIDRAAAIARMKADREKQVANAGAFSNVPAATDDDFPF